MNGTKIEDILLAMGIPAGIKGFTYIADAIQIFDERGTNISITKELYPAIAERNDTTPSRAERAIRHAFGIVRSYKGNYECIEYYIGFKNCENSSSLKMLYKRIKEDFEKTNLETLETEKWIINNSELRKIIQEEIVLFFGQLKGVRT